MTGIRVNGVRSREDSYGQPLSRPLWLCFGVKSSVRYKGGVRLFAYAILGLSALALAGCDGSGDSGNANQPAWTIDNLVDRDNASLVAEFNAYADSVDAPWERTPIAVVTELLRLDSSDNPNVSVVAEAAAEAAEKARVTVTYSRLLDDSVDATRNDVQLQRHEDIWRVEEIETSQSCKPGRGHQDFSGEPCV